MIEFISGVFLDIFVTLIILFILKLYNEHKEPKDECPYEF